MPHQDAEGEYHRLDRRWLEKLNARERGWPKRDQFKRFYRDVKGHKGSIERLWKPLTQGEPIPRRMAEIFAEYLRERLGHDDARFDEVFLPSRPPEDMGVWESPNSVLSALTDGLTDRDEEYLRTPRHYLEAARMTALTVGSRVASDGDPLDEDSCIRRGEVEMGRTVGRHAAWLQDISNGPGLLRTTMFITHKGERIGVCTVAPLSQAAFERVCAGELGDHNLTRGDLISPSPYVLIVAMTDGEGFQLTARERSFAQVRAVAYQLAYFTRRLDPYRPTLVTFAAAGVTQQLLQRIGFVGIGVNYHGTPHPIVVLRDPEEVAIGDIQGRIAYTLMTTSFRLYSIANQHLWDEEDAASRPGHSDPSANDSYGDACD